jgi:hypothetical protein
MNYEPVFLSIPDDCRSRWKLLRQFIRRWYGLELSEAGGWPRPVQAEEETLGIDLPPSFREWMALASELIEKGRFDIFRDSYEVMDLKALAAVSLLLQSEGDYYWAVQKENLAIEDPPVDGYWLDYRLSPERFAWFARDAQHITSFVMGHLAYCLHGAGGGCHVEISGGNDLLAEMKRSFDTHSTFDHLSIFEKPNIIAMIMPGVLDERVNLLVEIWKKVPRSEVPECIWAQTHGGGGFHGMLLAG